MKTNFYKDEASPPKRYERKMSVIHKVFTWEYHKKHLFA